MHSLVCAYCHVEYFFAGDGKYLIFPWKYGTTIEAIDKFYEKNQFVDWKYADSGADQALLAKARTLHRKAQLRWDFIAAENSMGFHNPGEALRILASATDLARQAQVKAILAVWMMYSPAQASPSRKSISPCP